MESKNISGYNIQVKEYLNRGYAELEKRNWEFARISFDKVILMDEENGRAYVGKILCDLRKRSIEEIVCDGRIYEFFGELFGTKIIDHYEFYSYNYKTICNAICADNNFRLELCSYAYSAACDFANDKKIKYAIDLFAILRDCMGGYEDSSDKLHLCQSYSEIEEKESHFYKSSKYYINDEKDILERISVLENNNNELNKYKRINTYFLASSWGLIAYCWLLRYISFVDIPIVGRFFSFLPMIAFLFQCVVGYITLKFVLNKDEKMWVFVIFGFVGSVKAFLRIKEKITNIDKEIKECKEILSCIEKSKEELVYKIQTMLGEDIEIFEYEAKGLDFMVGYGNALVEKYKTI